MNYFTTISFIAIINLFQANAYSQTISFQSIEKICYGGQPAYRVTAVPALKEGFGVSYSWSTGETSQSIIVTGADYSANVSCQIHCECGGEAFSGSTLTFPQQDFDLTTTAASCNGFADGSVTLHTKSKGISLAMENDKNVINGLSAGNHEIRIVNDFGCISSRTITITEPKSFPVHADIITTDATCFGYANGTAKMIFNKNNEDEQFELLWYNGATEAHIKNIAAGGYHVFIKKPGGGCVTKYFKVSEPSPVRVKASVTTNFNGFHVPCQGDKKGNVDYYAFGGTAPYELNFEHIKTNDVPQEKTLQARGLGAGNYYISATDAHGCTTIDSIKVMEPASISINLNRQKHGDGFDIECNGFPLILNPTIRGGAGNYQYYWTSRKTDNPVFISASDIAELKAGDFGLKITDGNGCIKSLNFSLSQPEVVEYEVNKIHNWKIFSFASLKMKGGSDGKYTINGKRKKSKVLFSFFWQSGSRDTQLTLARGNSCPPRTLSFNFSGPIRAELASHPSPERHKNNCCNLPDIN